MPSDEGARRRQKKTKEKQETETTKNIASITESIKILLGMHNRAQTEAKSHNQGMITWTKRTAIAVILYTGFTVGLFVITYCSYVAGNRAFAYFQVPDYSTIPDYVQKIRTWKIDFGIVNSGNTPTKNLVYAVSCTTKINDIDKFFDSTKPHLQLSIGPKAPPVKPNVCSIPNALSDYGPNVTVYVLGLLEYNDSVGVFAQHRTEACYEWNLAAIHLGDAAYAARPCETLRNHNCTDDECSRPN